MTEKFDTYTQKTKLYYILQVITILTILSILGAKITDLQLPLGYKPLLITLVILGLITIVINLLLTSTNFVKMYKKDGELIVTTESVTINEKTILLKDIRKIEVNANDYKGARSSDGSGNRIYITFDDKIITSRFVISSKDQQNNLSKILTQWKLAGIEII